MPSSSYFKVYCNPHFFSFGKFGFWSFNLRFPHFQTFFSEKAVPSWKWRGGGRGSRFSKVYPCLKDKDRQRQRQRQHIPNCMFQWSFLPSKHVSTNNHQWLCLPCLGDTAANFWEQKLNIIWIQGRIDTNSKKKTLCWTFDQVCRSFRRRVTEQSCNNKSRVFTSSANWTIFKGKSKTFTETVQRLCKDCGKVVQRLCKGCATFK